MLLPTFAGKYEQMKDKAFIKEQQNALKAAAAAQGKNLSDIARLIGLTPSGFSSQIIKGISKNMYSRISEALGVPVDALKPRPSAPDTPESSDIVAVLRGIIREKDETIRQQAEEIGRLRFLLQS